MDGAVRNFPHCIPIVIELTFSFKEIFNKSMRDDLIFYVKVDVGMWTTTTQDFKCNTYF